MTYSSYHVNTSEEGIRASALIEYLNDLKNQISTAKLNTAFYDAGSLIQQVTALSSLYLKGPQDRLLKMGDVQKEMFESFQKDMQYQVDATFGFNQEKFSEEAKSNKLASNKLEVAGLVEKFEKGINGTTYVGDCLRVNWDKITTKQWTFTGDELTKENNSIAVMKGKKEVDAFRKELIGGLSFIESARKLGQTLNNGKLFDSSQPDRDFEVAKFAVDSLKIVGSATQSLFLGMQRHIAEKSFSEITSSLSLSSLNLEMKDILADFKKSVTTDKDGNLLKISPVNGQNLLGTQKLEYKDYWSEYKKLNDAINEKINLFKTSKDQIQVRLLDIETLLVEKTAALNAINSGNDLKQREVADNLKSQIKILSQQKQVEQNDLGKVINNIKEFDSVNANIKGHLTSFETSERVANNLDLGFRLISMAGTISSLVGKSIAGSHDETSITSSALTLASGTMDFAGSIAKLQSMKNVSTGLGGTTALIGVGTSLAAFSQTIIDINKAPAGYEGHYIGEAVVQGASVAMGLAMGTLTTYAAMAGTSVSRAVPALGIIASLASAINPLQWAAFEQKQDQIDSVSKKSDLNSEDYETSAQMLASLLAELRGVEVGVYAANTSISVIGGAASTIAASTGIGVPVALVIAGVTAGLNVLLDSLQQVGLDDIAQKFADKIRAWNGGVEGFIKLSLDHQSDKELNKYLSDAQKLIEEGYDSVSALGSVHMSSSDLHLVGLTGVGGSLSRTQDFFSGFLEKNDLGTKEWQRETIKIDPKGGTIKRGDLAEAATGKSNYLSFISPLEAAGREVYNREETGKNTSKTTLEIKDLKGWSLIDGGDNTTFDLTNVVTKARSAHGAQLKDLSFVLNAGAGNDLVLMTDVTGKADKNLSEVNVDGGAGEDAVTYANLKHLVGGLNVTANSKGNIVVEKILDRNVQILQGEVNQYIVRNGKRTETLEYRYIKSQSAGVSLQLFDELRNIESLAGSKFNDIIDLSNYNNAFLVAGLDGNDKFTLQQGHAALGGKGDDIFIAVGNVKTKGATKSSLPDRLEVAGGEGYDKLTLISGEWAKRAFELGALYLISEEILKEHHDIREKLMPSVIASEAGEDIAVATVANMISKDEWAMTSFLAMDSIEEVVFDLKIAHALVFGKELDDALGKIDLNEYAPAARAFLDRSTVGNYTGLINFSYDLTQPTSLDDGISGLIVKGSVGNDLINGTAYDDVIFGGDGDDVLDARGGTNVMTGGEGKDTFIFRMADDFVNNKVTLIDYSQTVGVHDFRSQALEDRFVFEMGKFNISNLVFRRTGQSGADLSITRAESNLIKNHSFEVVPWGIGPNNPPWEWQRTGTGGVWQAQNDRKSDGNHSYALGGWGRTANSTLSQNVSLKTDREYTLSFKLGGVHNTLNEKSILELQLYGNIATPQTYTFEVTKRNGMMHHEIRFKPIDADTRIVFMQRGGFNGDIDIDIDDVQLRAQPQHVTIENFFTMGYSGVSLNDSKQVFTFRSNAGDNVMSYKELRAMVLNIELNIGEVGALSGVSNEEFKGDWANIIVGDFNGDGRDDFIRQEKGPADDDNYNTANIFISMADGKFRKIDDLGALSGVSNEIFKGDLTNIIVGDFNGDGKDDFIRQEKGVWDNDNIYTATLYLANNKGQFTNAGDLGVLSGVSNENFKGDLSNIIVGDFNGDGKDDFIRQEKGLADDDNLDEPMVYIATGDGKFRESGSLQDWSGISNIQFKGDLAKLVVGDFNGDGKDDFIRQGMGKLDDVDFNNSYLYLSSGINFNKLVGDLGMMTGLSSAEFKGDYTLTVGDFNGDGRDDLIRQGKGVSGDDKFDKAFVYLSDKMGGFEKLGELGALLGIPSETLKSDQVNIIAGDFWGTGASGLIRQEKNTWDDDSINTASFYGRFIII
jgi:Ca2+-binding RTX toxin-like protein